MATDTDWNADPGGLLTELTLEEKLSLFSSQWKGVERLGIPPFRWGGECLHGLCHTGSATVFPVPIALAATFDEALVRDVAAAISQEARARYFDEVLPRTDFVSLAYWTPNINLLRDARWGRGQETFGEDPHLSGALGAAFVEGLQGEDLGALNVVACAKHYAVHSGPEAIRTSFDAKIAPKLLTETYVPHFKKLVEAGVATVMSAYNAVNGKPCCAHDELLQKTLRDSWGFDGFVVSDAGAVAAMHRAAPEKETPDAAGAQWGFLIRQMSGLAGHGVTADAVESAAHAIRNGCDMALGDDFAPKYLGQAMDRGLLDESDVDRGLKRILSVAARLGILGQEQGRRTGEPKRDVLRCAPHLQLARRAAAESAVILKNAGELLPLDPEIHRHLAVSGPTAADVNVLLGNFYRGVSPRLVTLLEGIVEGAPEGVVATYLQGCELVHENLHDSSWSIGLAEKADVAIAAIGLSPLMEGEHGECIASNLGGDRDRLDLPPVQIDYLRRLKKEAGKPLVVIVTGGSPIIMPEVVDLADALLMAWYPGEQGGLGIADVLFGRQTPSGRLPFTIPAREADVPAFSDYSMRGRTYRYAASAPLFPFGFGLGYSPVEYSKTQIRIDENATSGVTYRVTAELSNAGPHRVVEKAQLYLRIPEDSEGPLCNLQDFQTIRIEPGQCSSVTFRIEKKQFQYVLEDGSWHPAGDAELLIAPHAPYPGQKNAFVPVPAGGRGQS